MTELPVPKSADDPAGIKNAAIVIAQALQAAGWELGALRGMTGEEEVLFDDSVQYWKPGQKDIDGEPATMYCAQVQGIWYPKDYEASRDTPAMVSIQITEG